MFATESFIELTWFHNLTNRQCTFDLFQSVHIHLSVRPRRWKLANSISRSHKPNRFRQTTLFTVHRFGFHLHPNSCYSFLLFPSLAWSRPIHRQPKSKSSNNTSSLSEAVSQLWWTWPLKLPRWNRANFAALFQLFTPLINPSTVIESVHPFSGNLDLLQGRFPLALINLLLLL